MNKNTIKAPCTVLLAVVNVIVFLVLSFQGMTEDGRFMLQHGAMYVPYLIKNALQKSKPLVVIPGTFIAGAVFCMICDLIARMAFAPMELNISTVTSIFGAPIVIFMMVHGQKGR